MFFLFAEGPGEAFDLDGGLIFGIGELPVVAPDEGVELGFFGVGMSQADQDMFFERDGQEQAGVGFAKDQRIWDGTVFVIV